MNASNQRLLFKTLLALLPEGASEETLAQVTGQHRAALRTVLGELENAGEMEFDAHTRYWRFAGTTSSEVLLRVLQTDREIIRQPLPLLFERLRDVAQGSGLPGIRRILESIPEQLPYSSVDGARLLLELGIALLSRQECSAFEPIRYRHFLELIILAYIQTLLLQSRLQPLRRLLKITQNMAKAEDNEQTVTLLEVMENLLEPLCREAFHVSKLYGILAEAVRKLKAFDDPELLSGTMFFRNILSCLEGDFCIVLDASINARLKMPESCIDGWLTYLYSCYAMSSSLYLGRHGFARGLCKAIYVEKRGLTFPQSFETWQSIILFMDGKVEEALEHITRCLCRINRGTERRSYLFLLYILALFQLFYGNVRQSHAMMKECVQIARRYGCGPLFPLPGFLDLLAHYHLHGLPPFPEYSLEAHLEDGLLSRSRLVRTVSLRVKAALCGEKKEALSLLRQSLTLAQAMGSPCEEAKTLLYMAYVDPEQSVSRRDKALALLEQYTSLDYSRYPFFPDPPPVKPFQPSSVPQEWISRAAASCSERLARWDIDSISHFYALLVHVAVEELDAEQGMVVTTRENCFYCLADCHFCQEHGKMLEDPALLTSLRHILQNKKAQRLKTQSTYLLGIPIIAKEEEALLLLCSSESRKGFAPECESDLYLLSLTFSAELRAQLRLERGKSHLRAPDDTKQNISLEVVPPLYDTPYYGPRMKTLLRCVHQAASTDLPILLLGETGVGKEALARKIHVLSGNKGPFIAVHPASTPESLFESAFFGHEKGAFTGATAQKNGFFELADKGTLFIDEVGEFPLTLQVKLLRVLQEQTFVRVGGTKERRSRFRLLAATNKDLWEEVQAQRFREDLFYRISVVPLTIPPLRERPEDIPVLARFFWEAFRRRYGRVLPPLSQENMVLLQKYSWPGNIRELKGVVERAAALNNGLHLDFSFLAPPVAIRSEAYPEQTDFFYDLPSLETLEKRYIEYLLEKTNGKICGESGIEHILKISRPTVYAKLKKYGFRS